MCRPTDIALIIHVGDIFERKAIVRAALLKLFHFKSYLLNFDKISGVGFQGIANKNILSISFISRMLGELAAIVYVFYLFLTGWA